MTLGLLPCLSLAATAREAAPHGVSAAALLAARQFLCPHGGAPVPGQRGRCRPARGDAGGGTVAGGLAGWDAGLPPAARSQAACPPGTAAEPVPDRPATTRCVPR
jgi:hypothetical protein